ncbi:nucleotidyltransferase family protein [Rheinheimera soli]|uniref:Nucleotidyltransferase n=1 Tax=Rheinheimera soli TaxID=443616 RepID=A0ABU1W1J8_9GAMM|nr:putative nucleotidyltransferase [Rheinheimera soli]
MENTGIKPSVALATHREEILKIIAAHHASNVRVFGSVLQGTDTEQSDLDLLVDPTAEMTMLDIGAVRHKLLKLLNVQVDVLTPNALPEKFRAAVLAKAKPL